ncbi:hypothetical protein N566_20765 [Streptomycetaceae bacterium MP113-05]|nr:hypothetical protein N566_20765 [Streptomycetaceae bacterium MP113-05]
MWEGGIGWSVTGGLLGDDQTVHTLVNRLVALPST